MNKGYVNDTAREARQTRHQRPLEEEKWERCMAKLRRARSQGLSGVTVYFDADALDVRPYREQGNEIIR